MMQRFLELDVRREKEGSGQLLLIACYSTSYSMSVEPEDG
jgi:hypothetical protein